jgi:hypothetical protein
VVRKTAAAVAAVIVAAGVGACGDDEESTSATSSSPAASCIESFTSSAPEVLPRLARFSHAKGEPVIVGEYAGAEFSAEIYDGTTEGTGVDATVAPGACVITAVSPDFGPLYVFVVTDDGSWHRLLESDPDVPLVPKPEAQLEHVEEVELEQIAP